MSLDNKYKWFWGFVNDHCAVSMSQSVCQQCGSYAQVCSVDSTACYASANQEGNSCPYEQCRKGVIEYLIAKIQPFSVGVCVVLGVLVILGVITCMLICYTPRDDLSTQLYKSGTLSGEKYNAEKNARMKLRTNKV